MKLASCGNCAHRKESNETEQASPLRVLTNADCNLAMAPKEEEFLCPKYAMTEAFRDEILGYARKEFERDVNQAMLKISVMRAERDQAWAG